jgi:hypothetical protein
MNTLQGNVFQRIEKKYLLTQEKYQEFLGLATPFITQDRYAAYNIYNIYFDTRSYDLIRNSIEKPKYKEKLRLRSYTIPGPKDTVYLEIKKKWAGIVSKRRIPMSFQEAEAYLAKGIQPAMSHQILNEIDYFLHFYQPERKLYLAYDRIAYTARLDPSVRITFDHNIRSRSTDLDLAKGDYGDPLLEPQSCLMEIKVPAALPLWLTKILSDLQIYPVSFSKYGFVYMESVAAKSNNTHPMLQFSMLKEDAQCLQTYSTPQQAV